MDSRLVAAIRVHEHGDIGKLKIDRVPIGNLHGTDIVVSVKYASINHLDLWVRRGLPGVRFSLPLILGSDGAGIVEEVGSEVTDIKKGDRVLIAPGRSCGKCEMCLSGRDNLCREYKILGEHCDGVDAELLTVPRAGIIKLPDSVSLEEAAASALVFMTAYQMLVEKATVQPGEKVLVLGASSGVGSAAIQIAKFHGASVIAVAGSEDKLEKAKKLGADEVINYRTSSIHDEVRRLTGKKGVEVVFEHVGKSTWQESILSTCAGGRIVTCGATTGYDAVTDLRYLFSKQLTIYGSTMGSKATLFKMLNLMSQKKFNAVIDRIFSYRDVAKAHEVMESGDHFGKILLHFGD
ncbi:MAG: zinc-binding dehydrogenase [Candidatus Kryptoniota bacterium]